MKDKGIAKRVANAAILTALSMIFGYVESLVPLSAGVPGMKLGLANLVVLTGLYLLSPCEVLVILVARIVLSSFLFGNMSSMIYSMAGGLAAFLVMLVLKRVKIFSITGVSIAGAVCHNLGQLTVAMLVVKNTKLIYYSPVLMIAGAVAGAVIGIMGRKCRRIIK
ncbi:MAG: Gx transporter family protein [Roseburia sp.]|nr:Gx transporter family protein [Roseburia sp.]